MAAEKPKPITFVVPGQDARGIPGTRGTSRATPAPPIAELPGWEVKQSIQVGTVRGDGAPVTVSATPGEDVVVLGIANGPELTLHPEHARLLLQAQVATPGPGPRQGIDGTARSAGAVSVPARLQWRGMDPASATSRGVSRGGIGDIVLSAVHVLTGKALGKVAKFTASSLIVRRFDDQVDAGVYALTRDSLPKLKGGTSVSSVPPAADGRPLLMLVHGTFSDTSAFHKLWTHHPTHVRTLFEHYGGRVYGLDHPTLGVSPIANALTLAQAMPRNAKLHLLTHSRGGLVAEVLARICSNPDDDFRQFNAHEHRRDREDLASLAALVKKQKLQVERVVRVACPARGTLLASRRLDAYLSVFKWVMSLAHVPVVPLLLEFLGEVAKQRADPGVLPGLAAQMPESPLIQWLHRADQPIRGDLRVVAGDIEADSVTSWLKTLLSDAFYWTDHDLVVQTRSMYGGGPRGRDSGGAETQRPTATFLLDRGARVNHFEYFGNDLTAGAITSALKDDAPTGFRTIGPLSQAGKDASGVRARRPASDDRSASEKPAVFLLPGILGSHLAVDDRRIWLGWRIVNGLDQLKFVSTAKNVKADGPLGMFYERLAEFLSDTHEVVEFAFDWRRPIEDEARRLAGVVQQKLDARRKTQQPVRILAHSMGGILARVMQLERPEVWDAMMAHKGGRLVMLGTPNGGSWVPMQVLTGDNTFVNTLAMVGAPFHEHEARTLMAEFPGFMLLQAGLLDDELGLSKRDRWSELQRIDLETIDADAWHGLDIQRNAHRWGLPPQKVLDRSVSLWKRLAVQRDQVLSRYSQQMLLVVGKAQFTPDGYSTDDQGLVYLDSPDDGDGTVTLQSALVPGVRTWIVDGEHSRLPDLKEAFDGYLELLEQGTTSLLSALPAERGMGSTAGQVLRVPVRPSRSRAGADPPEAPNERNPRRGRGGPPSGAAQNVALQISVVHGDLSFVSEPLLLGHYRSMRLTGTERVMDHLIGAAMSKSLDARLYPGAPGSYQVFVNTRVDPANPWQVPRPKAVVIVGLGDEGKLRPTELSHSVTQGVIAWGQRLAEAPGFSAHRFDLAATLIGSGGASMQVDQSAQAIADGVYKANRRLQANHWPTVGHLSLIEVHLDRATEALHALRHDPETAAGCYRVDDTIRTGSGGLERPLDAGYRGADYDFVTAVRDYSKRGEAVIAYTLDTRRARSELRAQAVQEPLIRELVVSASNHNNRDAQIGNTLFQLLVPLEMRPFFDGTNEMVLQLENETAGIPWEILDSRTDPTPWGIRSKLLRKLRTVEFRTQVTDASTDSGILVIGEPLCDPDLYPRLPGAWNEATAVAKCLSASDNVRPDQLKTLISEDSHLAGPDACSILNALMERSWRIVHIAGHGEPPEKIGAERQDASSPQEDGDPRGVVLSNGTFLGAREIRSLAVVPELVFVNCCHLAARNPGQLLDDRTAYDRPRFASGIAEALIKIGVRCVIAAGWAVDDEAARCFATSFYGALCERKSFIEAVAEARKAAYDMGGNTWAAYQCYGDPDWRFLPAGGSSAPINPKKKFAAVVSSSSLKLALDLITVESKYRGAKGESQRSALEYLETTFAHRWGAMGEIAEAFGNAWSSTDTQNAIKCYRAAIEAADGTASLKATEQLANLVAREAWSSVEKTLSSLDDLVDTKATARRRTGRRPTTKPGRAAAERALRTAAQAARNSITEAVEMIDTLKPTLERQSLVGSAYKRLAMIEDAMGRKRAEQAALANMQLHYKEAERLGRESGENFFYPALNRIAAEIVTRVGTRGWKGLDSAATTAARQDLDNRIAKMPDFWSVVGKIELRLYEAVATGGLAKARADIEREFEDTHRRVQDSWKWKSVRDTQKFVLKKYSMSRASDAEKRAARAMLDRLDLLALGDRDPENGAG